MKAVGVIEYGGPEALQVVDLPDPQPGPGEIRIRVHAAAVSPTDTFVRNGARAKDQAESGPPPYVPGMDAAGVVDKIGPDTDTDLAVDDRVMAIVLPKGSHGAYSEYVVVPARSVVRAPAGLSHAEAATLPMNGLTARLALDTLALSPGATLAVSGAAGAFGGYVVQLAVADGLEVVADASEADRALVGALGAAVVLPRGDDFAQRVRERYPEGVDGAADGALLHELLAPAVRDGGTIITVRGYRGESERGVTFTPILVSRYRTEREKLTDLGRLAETGAVTARVAATVPKEEAAEAHRRLEAGGTRGRLVIEF